MSGARGGELRRLAALTVTLAVTDFKLRYYGNALGYLWTVGKPLLLFGVIYLAFTEILPDVGAQPHFAAALISGLVLYNFFAEATGTAVGSLVASAPLVKKIPVPALAIPLSIVLRTLFTLGLNLIAVAVFFAIDGVEVTRDWLQLPLILLVLVALTTAMASLLANLFVSFRDTGQIWDVMLQVLFWASPIIYSIQLVVDAGLEEVIMLNPLAVILVQFRHAIIDQSEPSALEVAGGGELAVASAIALAALAASVLLHRRTMPRLAEQI